MEDSYGRIFHHRTAAVQFFLHVAQTYQQDHHGPGTGQHTELRKSVLIMMSVISSGHSALAT